MPNPTPAFSQAEMDQAARARGYRDYNHMIFVMQNRLPQPKMPGEIAGRGGSSIGNFLQNLWQDPSAALAEAFAWHPRNTLRRVTDALASANQRNDGN